MIQEVCVFSNCRESLVSTLTETNSSASHVIFLTKCGLLIIEPSHQTLYNHKKEYWSLIKILLLAVSEGCHCVQALLTSTHVFQDIYDGMIIILLLRLFVLSPMMQVEKEDFKEMKQTLVIKSCAVSSLEGSENLYCTHLFQCSQQRKPE